MMIMSQNKLIVIIINKNCSRLMAQWETATFQAKAMAMARVSASAWQRKVCQSVLIEKDEDLYQTLNINYMFLYLRTTGQVK